MTDQDRSDLEEAVRLLREWAEVMKGLPWGPDVAATTRAFLTRHPEKPKLLPCPFCGGGAEIIEIRGGAVYIECTKPGPTGVAACYMTARPEHPFAGAAETVAAWNRRATPVGGPLSGGKAE